MNSDEHWIADFLAFISETGRTHASVSAKESTEMALVLETKPLADFMNGKHGAAKQPLEIIPFAL
jgi:hypothetical protein